MRGGQFLSTRGNSSSFDRQAACIPSLSRDQETCLSVTLGPGCRGIRKSCLLSPTDLVMAAVL